MFGFLLTAVVLFWPLSKELLTGGHIDYSFGKNLKRQTV